MKLSQFIQFRYGPTQPNFRWIFSEADLLSKIRWRFWQPHFFRWILGSGPKFSRSGYLAAVVARNTTTNTAQDHVYGYHAKVTVRVYPVHLINAGQCQVAANSQSAYGLLSPMLTVIYYYSAQKQPLIVPSHRW